MVRATPGYSGTPLARKLGIRPGLAVLALGEVPRDYRSWVGPLPQGARITTRGAAPHAAVHLFATRRAELARMLRSLRSDLAPDGFLWVSWPKRSSGAATDITEDTIRDAALPLGLVDVKVCAVSEIWSGLKLVIRRSERRAPSLSRRPGAT